MIIYKTTNLLNGKIYIGQNSTNDSTYFGSGLLITNSIKYHGIENFKKEILEECTSKEQLNEREKYWIEFYNSTNRSVGYNISHGGTGGKLVDAEGKKGKTYEEYYGKNKADEIKKKFSVARKGKKRGFKNVTAEEAGKKISEALKGTIRTEEQKSKISESLKEFYKTPKGVKQIANLIKSQSGKKQTTESNTKRSEALKGKRPKVLEVHPSAKYWYFYDKDNTLVLETLGNRTKILKELGTNQRRIIIFTDLQECLNHTLDSKKDFKVFTKKYYGD